MKSERRNWIIYQRKVFIYFRVVHQKLFLLLWRKMQWLIVRLVSVVFIHKYKQNTNMNVQKLEIKQTISSCILVWLRKIFVTLIKNDLHKHKAKLLSKFIYSEKATQCCEISTFLLSVCTVDKSKVEISQNFLAFSEYTNFSSIALYCT